MTSSKYTKCIEFIEKYAFAGHGSEHAKSVYMTAIKITKSLLDDYDVDILMITALLHDGIDHKNPNSPTQEEFENFISSITDSERTKIILKIINNISYTKEVKKQLETLEYPYNIYRDAISDADKIEAIGTVGIKRCIEYTKSVDGKVPDDVVKHCHEKLLKLLPGGFIKTEMGKVLAQPHHQVIVDYVKMNEKQESNYQ